jgi:DMSO/TMAO reductase YedYZ molybdopterin-dependent catalytic subunit
MKRRSFVAASVATAGAAVAAGVAGEVISGKRFPATAAANAATPGRTASAAKPGASASSAPAGALPKADVPAPPVPKGAELDIPGLSAFYTPNNQFYRVDTAFNIPKLSTETWELKIHGMVDKPITLTYEDLIRRPLVEHDTTLCCVAEYVGGPLTGNARWLGARLADILREAGVQSGAQQLVMTDPQGMTLGSSVDAVMDGRESLLAIGMNGEPLLPEHGFPVRVVVPGLYGYTSAAKWLVDMEVTTYAAYDVYYTKRGWAAQQDVIKVESRIDTPKTMATLKAGKNVIAGVAWAEHIGVEAVEVGIDGEFFEATLAVQDALDTWRQWYYIWDATPGAHKVQVRATDRVGVSQTTVNQAVFPSGATGLHTIHVTVA